MSLMPWITASLTIGIEFECHYLQEEVVQSSLLQATPQNIVEDQELHEWVRVMLLR